MKRSERNKLVELTKRAVDINEKLLANEKGFIDAVSSGKDISSLGQMNEMLNQLCRKEHLYLGAAKFLIKKMDENRL